MLNLGKLSTLGATGNGRSWHAESGASDEFVRRP